MTHQKKINVLVIPDLFPKYRGDLQGIFIVDYLTSTSKQCNNTVLFGRLTAEKKGVQIENEKNYTIHKFSVSSKKIASFLKPFFYILWFIKGYRTGKQFKNIDIIHAHGSILSGTLSLLLSKKLRIPFIITEHQGPFSMTSDNLWKKLWTSFIMQKANAVLTVSNHLKQEILDTPIKPKHIIVTYNPVDTELFRLRENKSYKNILFVGRLDNFKGALRCVVAFEMLYKQLPGWTFTIIGDGEDYKPIESFIEAHPHLKNQIILKGQLAKSEIALEMQNSSFLVFPSKHESFGLVIAEALSSGLPVIVGDKTAPQEFVDKENGLLVPAYDLIALSKSIQLMTESFPQYNSLAIRTKIVENFGFKSFEKKLVNIYLSTINKC